MIDRDTDKFTSQFKYDFSYQEKDLVIPAKPYIKVFFNPDNVASEFLSVKNCICPRCGEFVNLKIGANVTCTYCGLNVSLTYRSSTLREFDGFYYRTSEATEREMEKREKHQLKSKIKLLVTHEYQHAIISILNKNAQYQEHLAVN